METKKTVEDSNQSDERHILVALDESENGKRALLYVADFLGGQRGFRATLLNIISEPPENHFDSDTERNVWIENQRIKAKEMLDNYRMILLQSGFLEDKVAVRVEVRKCPSIADCILDVQKKLECCTVVIGRRGISKKEEFLFGSTSNKVLHSLKNCVVWVVE